MNRTRKTLLLVTTTALSIGLVGTVSLPAAAQQVPAPTTATTPPTTPAVVDNASAAGTTTTTSATTPVEDTTGGPSAPAPRSYDTVTVTRSVTPNRPLLITGALLLTGTYVTTAAIQQSSGREVQDSNLLIPVAGPWLNLSDRRCDGCDNETRNVAMVIGSGILQGAGAGMMILSLFVPQKVEAATIQAGPVKLHFAPSQVGRTGMGAGAVGVF